MNGTGRFRYLWITFGVTSLVCGAVGAVLPLLPTTPFILLSAYAFARSSPRLHGWLRNHAHFGPLIRNWTQYGAISRRGKVMAVITMVATPLASALLGAPGWAIAAQIVVLLGVGTFVVTRPEV